MKKNGILVIVIGFCFLSINMIGSQADLFRAIQNGNVNDVKRLILIPSINVNMQYYDASMPFMTGSTPLLIAAGSGYREIVQELLKVSGIDVNLKNNMGDTALFMASYRGYVEIVKELLKVPGIDVNAQNNDGNTALMESKNIEIIKLLLLHGAAIKYAQKGSWGDDIANKDVRDRWLMLPDSNDKRMLFAIFDAVNVQILPTDSELNENKKNELVQAYDDFLKGNHQELRNQLLEAPYGLMKAGQKEGGEKQRYFYFYRDRLVEAIVQVFKKDSIKPLLYFLAETKYQRNMADILLEKLFSE